jgi:O-methyltransferase
MSATAVERSHTQGSSSPQGPAPAQLVIGAGLGFIVSSCMQTFTKLEIPDLIANGTTRVADLAKKAGFPEDALYRVLRVLEMAGMVREVSSRSFALTEAGSLLRTDANGSMRGIVQYMTDPLHYKVYGSFTDSLQRGKTPFEDVFGEPVFKWFFRPENREEAEIFHKGMVSFSSTCAPAFLESYDFTQFQHIMDLGGGLGGIVRAILKGCPKLKGTVADLPEVVEQTNHAIAADGLGPRCSAIACDFFKAVPSGADAYFMKHILHDWNDQDATRILKNIRAVIPSHGKLILGEAVVPSDGTPHPAKLIDIEMLAFLQGKERTESEWRALLSGARFNLNRVIYTKSPLDLIEATPA